MSISKKIERGKKLIHYMFGVERFYSEYFNRNADIDQSIINYSKYFDSLGKKILEFYDADSLYQQSLGGNDLELTNYFFKEKITLEESINSIMENMEKDNKTIVKKIFCIPNSIHGEVLFGIN